MTIACVLQQIEGTHYTFLELIVACSICAYNKFAEMIALDYESMGYPSEMYLNSNCTYRLFYILHILILPVLVCSVQNLNMIWQLNEAFFYRSYFRYS